MDQPLAYVAVIRVVVEWPRSVAAAAKAIVDAVTAMPVTFYRSSWRASDQAEACLGNRLDLFLHVQ